jgi:hypothetical protein
MAKWAIASNAAVGSEDSPGGRIGEELVAETINLVITNVTNGVHSGYNITAANYKVDGGVESGTGTNIWLPPAASSGFVWAANEHIAQVAFTDLGIAGDASNTVNAAVTLTAFTPEKSITFNAAIVEKDDNPPVLSSAAARSLSLETRWNYNANQTVVATALTADATFSDVADGDATNHTRKKLSGTAPGNTTTGLASFKFTAASGYHYLDTLSLPTFSNLNSKSLNSYGDAYSWRRGINVYEDGKLKEVTFTLSYTPPVKLKILEQSNINSFDSLGHTFTFPITIRQDTVSTVDTIYNVSYRPKSTHARGLETIRVFGAVGAAYSISVQKKTNTLSNVTAASNGHYNFSTRAFQTAQSPFEATIGGNGVTTHEVLLPAVTTSTRYDITISGLTGGSSVISALAAVVPKLPGDATIIKHGVSTLTIKPITNTPANFGTLPSNVTITKPIKFKDSGPAYATGSPIEVIGGTNGASSTRLVLERYNYSVRVAPGMLVTGDGVTHGSTISSVRGNIITLSTASTIATSTKLKIIKESSSIVPFSFAITPNSNTLNVNATTDLVGEVGGFNRVKTLVNGATSASTGLILDSTKGITPGMTVTGGGVNVAAGTKLTVSSVTNATVVVLSEVQSFLDNASLVFSGSSNVSTGKLHSIQANKSGSNIIITGYLNIATAQVDTEIRIYIDDIITVA